MMHRTLAMIVVTALLCVAAVRAQEAPAAAPQKKPSIAVNMLEGRGVTPDEAATLTDVLRNSLSETARYQVMERTEMESILKEQGFQRSGACTDAACLVEIGQILGIEQLVAGSIGKVGQAYSINVRIVSVKTGEIVRAVSQNYTGPIENLLTNEMPIVARRLAGTAPRTTERAGGKVKAPLIIGLATAGVLAIGGVVVYLVLKKKNSPSGGSNTAEVVVTW